MLTGLTTRARRLCCLALLLGVGLPSLAGCGEPRDVTPSETPKAGPPEAPSDAIREPDAAPPAPSEAPAHPLLGSRPAVGELPIGPGASDGDDDPARAALATAEAAATTAAAARLTVDYPLGGSIFPPAFTSPTFLWHDGASEADTWLVRIPAGAGASQPLTVLLAGVSPPQGEIDERALGPTNEIYRPTPYQASARSWTPAPHFWDAIQARATEAPLEITFHGFASGDPSRLLSAGTVEIRTSKDEVGAPIFYRDVPLMPSAGEKGKIQPLGSDAMALIAWRLRDVSRPESRVVLTDMPSCANCHSFSRDGSTFGMDVDGPGGDKGTYAIAPLSESMSIGYEDVITWNSYEDKPEGHKTIGFLSRLSPDGRYAITTLNEELYVANFLSYKFLQVFFPTRGILAIYDAETKTMRALPGADDPEYVHCSPVWTPDGKELVFSRAPGMDPRGNGKPLATRPNDPNEPQIKYDLYRIPFNGGAGGKAVRIQGASENGMSNTFPKVSPDGKWIVYTKCKNGLLMRPDGKLWVVPYAGGEARELECNLDPMNSWHSFSPNGRWLVWSSKANRPYTQMFLTHLDQDMHASPAILIPNSTAANRAVNIPEFLNAPYESLKKIDVPAVKHRRFYFQGTRALEYRKFADAIPFLAKAVELEPEFSRAHLNLGYALIMTGNQEAAFHHFKRAVEVNPRDPFILSNMAAALVQVGRMEDATSYAEKALEIDPDFPQANNTMGMALVKVGRLEDGVTHFERALAMQPGMWLARRNLGFALMNLGRTDEAVKELEIVLRIRPNDQEVRKLLAELEPSRN